MDTGKISTRYARAIYHFAESRGDEKRLQGEMQILVSQFAHFPSLKSAMENPTISEEEKEKVLLSAIGAEASKTFCKAVHLIAGNGRSRCMQSVALMYDKIYRHAKRMLQVSLTTVEPASREMQQLLVDLVSDEGEMVDFDAQSDGALIGGFVLQIEDRRLDASIKNQLNQIKLDLIS
ncbi:MAG: ATP synthase F1 subunit delta [Dysgonamonadaceae bacterium]|jgi:F-type H+-transporting ATPase subunit delta|nr:ATP synthase F1 subunit delta [Dysgonamonadaceae bacterium]